MTKFPTITTKLREEIILAAGMMEKELDAVLLKFNGNDITSELRDQLLADVKAGKHVELTMTLDSYDQTPNVRNRNFVRLADKALPKFAASGKGKPFLRDHSQYDSMSVAGRITSSTLSKVGDTSTVQQEAKISAPWAVDLALRGLLSTVSTSWRATEGVDCSVCKTPILSSCYHWPGDKLKLTTNSNGTSTLLRDRTGDIVVEWIYNGAECIETSIVPVPAVVTAKITGIRASLSAGSADENFDVTDILPEKTTMSDTDLAALNARLARAEKIADLSDIEKAHFKRLSGMDQESFLAKSAADRSEMFKVVHTAVDGTQFTAQDDPRLIAMSKQGDTDRAAHKKSLQEASAKLYVTRAETELSHLAGTVEQRATLLQAIDTIEKPEDREAILKSIKDYDVKQAPKFQRAGSGGRKDPKVGGDPEAQLQEMADKIFNNPDNELTAEQAYEQALTSVEGQKLYAEMEAAKRS